MTPVCSHDVTPNQFISPAHYGAWMRGCPLGMSAPAYLHMSALDLWHQEIALGRRTMYAPMDTLWKAACQEAADDEFEREVAAPQRAYLKELTTPKPKRPPRPAKWERDLAMMAECDDDGS